MSTRHVVNLLRIAASIEASDPVLSRQLERSALAVINPGAKKFEEHVGEVVEVLKNLKAELEKADKQLDTDDAQEFAKFFDDEAKAETEDLRQMLKVSAVLLRYADDTAGVMDKVKGFFKKKKPEADEKSDATYQMDDSEMDEFVEGKRDWSEPSAKVEKESRENKEFFEDAKGVQSLIDKVRDKPSRNMVRTIIEDLGGLIERGTKLMKGERKKAPVLDESEGKKEAPKKDGGPGVPKDFNLEGTVDHYTDMLKEAAGDPKKLSKYLKEFFNAVKPALEEDRASLAAKRAKILPLLVRTASANPGVCPVLLPIIRRWTGK
jgi:DNA-binding ferritin-like protein